MTTFTAIGLMAAAGVLGMTHAVEPDHVAGISAMTGGVGRSRLAALIGACFGVGHVLLVIAWLVGATLLLHVTTFPPVLETAGFVVVGVFLVGLSLWLGVSATRRLVHSHEHDHGDGVHAHVHLHGLGSLGAGGHGHASLGDDHGPADGVPHDHEHSTLEYLKIGTVGALFSLSPPVSMIVFLTVVLANAPAALVVPVVLAYAVSITTFMSLIGYGSGVVFRLARDRGPRVHAALQLVVSGMVLAVAVYLLSANVPAVLG